LVDGAGDARFYEGFPEVQEEAESRTGKAEVGEELFFMGVVDLLDTLDLQQDLLVDDDVRTEALIKLQPPIFDSYGYLTLDPKLALPKFMRSTASYTDSNNPGPSSLCTWTAVSTAILPISSSSICRVVLSVLRAFARNKSSSATP
jgi:hypothetical protein